MAIEMALTLRLHSPLALHQSRSNAQYVSTLDYIPGTALRGALAEAYLMEHKTPDQVFQALFLSGEVKYGDLWPSTAGGTTVLLPATAQVCKRFKFEHTRSFRDSLLDALSGVSDNKDCPEPGCKEPLERVVGYLESVGRVVPLAARSRLRVNTAIARKTGSVAREMLFTQHTLVGRQRGKPDREIFFRGTIRLHRPALQGPLSNLLPEGTALFLGANRSRGLGEVEVVSWQPNSLSAPLQERWHEFNTAAQQAGGDANQRYFSLTLLSHLALCDDLLRPVLGGLTPRHLGLPEDVHWVRYAGSGQPVRFLRTAAVPGWNAGQGLPKSDTVALARGSVLLFRCDASLEQAVLTQLATLESEGLGRRRDEGFGRLAACYPIHYRWWR